MKSKIILFITTLFLVFIPIVNFAQINPAPITGTTSNFLLFTSAGDITNAGTTSTYSGSIGTNAGNVIGFETLIQQPTNLYRTTPETAQCALDLQALYNDLVVRIGTIRVGVYGSETLTPGVYSTGGAIAVNTDLTLDGGGDPNARFIIKTGGPFTMAATAKILLTNGTQAKNVFWVIAGAAAIAANCEARGTFVSQAGAISFGANAMMEGSALTMAGAITTVEGIHLATPPPVATNTMILLGNQTIISGSTPADLVVTGNINPVIKWQSASNSAFTSPKDILHFSTILSSSCMGNLITTTYYRAVILIDGIYAYSNSVVISTTAAPKVRTTGSFVLYSATGAITNYGASTYLSNIGTYVGAITGFPNPSDPLLHAADPLTLTAKEYLQDLFTTINAYPITNSSHSVAFGSGEILFPGVYLIGAAATMGGVLTLDGQNNTESLFIIKITGALALAANTEIKLINGATTDNVFWIIDGAFSTGVNSIVSGTFICKAGAIAFADNSLIHGRTFTMAGAITLANSKFTYVLPYSPTIVTSGNQVVNSGSQPTTITITGMKNPVLRWEKSTDIIFTSPIAITNDTATLTGSEIGRINATTYIRAVLSNGSIKEYSPITTLSVLEEPITIAGTVNSDQSLCEGSFPEDIILTGNNGSVTKWQRSLTDDFLSPIDILSNNTKLTGIVIGEINTTTYFRAVVQNCACSSAYSNYVKISVLPSVGGAVNSNQEFASPTQPKSLILSGNSDSVIKWQSSLSVDFKNANDIINTTNTLTGADIGVVSLTTYYRAVTQNCSLQFVYSTPALITVSAITTWNGLTWSNGYPSSSNSVVFAKNLIITTDIKSLSLTVNAGVSVVVGSGNTVTLGGGLTIDPSGSFTLNNNANLLQPDGVVNTGVITVKKNSSELYRLDSTLWSSPVTGQNLNKFSPATLSNRFYFYDSTASVNGAYAPVFNNSLFPGPTEANYTFEMAKGYLIRSPNTFPSYVPAVYPSTISAIPGVSYEGEFTGTPNNGTIKSELNTALNGFNLIGNPYPSAISIETFLETNSATIDGAIWLWRKINDLGTGVGYATVTNAGLTSIQPGVIEGISSGIIGIGQGFFVKVKTGLSTVNIVFNNTMRNENTSHLFYKTTNKEIIEKHRIWLNLSSATETISQNLIGYVTGATNGVDYSFEGKNFGAVPISLTSIVDDNEYNIQARSLPFDPADIVPLNFTTNVAGTYSISIDHVDGLFETNQQILLKDNLTGNLQNLKQKAYSFDSQIGNFKTRFEIIYQKQLGVNNPKLDDETIVIFKQNDILNINSGHLIMDKIEIYDVAGQLLFSLDNVDTSSQKISMLSIKNQMLVVKIKTIDNKFLSKKIIY
ncbi:ice-binding family protein [Flavobacterium sp. ACAM 123]|uniref:ice-binding family protein n=1 Tax=Flavobacterium sp. ACAM 123 TaxID=1189620 RepID=UPI00031126A1|nr:ice-binding family protein [Flavobacterium sp. ACAM 123]